MWDRPDLMNLCSSLLFGLVAVALFYGAGFALARLPVFRLQEVRVHGALEYVTREDVDAVVRRGLRGNFFTLDLREAQAAFLQLNWVKAAAVRRRWPNSLEVELVEHRPLARWHAGGLVNVEGERFTADYPAELPEFSGPAGAEAVVTERYRNFLAALQPLGKLPAKIKLTERRAWEVQLDDGLTVALGREDGTASALARLQRFVSVYPYTVARLTRAPAYVDLRYPNGFAVNLPGFGGGEKRTGEKRGVGAARQTGAKPVARNGAAQGRITR